MRLEKPRHGAVNKLQHPGEDWWSVFGLGEVCFDSDGSFRLISDKPDVYG